MLTVLQIVAAPTAAPGGEIGITGPERRTLNLVTRWKAVEIAPVVCYPRRGKLWREFEASGVPLVDFEIGSKFDFAAISRIAGIARAHQARVIHTQGPASLDLIAVLAADRNRIASVVTRPVMIEDEINRSSVRRFIYAAVDRMITARRATCYVAVSKAGYDHLKHTVRLDDGRLRLVHNGIDLAKFNCKAVSNSDGSARTPPVVLAMVGHLLDYKNWPDFIEAVCQLKSSGLNVRAVAVGEGEERAALEALVQKRGMQDAIAFWGYRPDVGPALAEADIFLFTTLREGLSVAVIEAMASGLPIIATDVGGIAEQVEMGRNGFIVAPRDLVSMVAFCAGLARYPDLRARMGAESRRIAEERFGEDQMLMGYASCYREAAAAAGAQFKR